MRRNLIFLTSLLVLLCWVCTLNATIVTTVDGNGADTFVTNDETNDNNSIMGTEQTLEIRNHEGTQQRIGYLRFDISSVEVDDDHYFGGDLTGATLTLNVTGTQEKFVSVYGLVDGANDLWDEATLSYNTAPGVITNPPIGRPVPSGSYRLDNALLQKLGQIRLGTNGLYSSDTNTLNMDSFLAQDTNKLITIIIVNEQSDPEANWLITTKESSTPELAPSLTFPNAVQPLKVIWVYDTINGDSNSVQDDQFWIDWLVATEYDLDAKPDKWTQLDTSRIAELNDADLVIFSRFADSNAYADDANETAAWASITTPILSMEDWSLSEAGLQLFAEAINALTEQPKVCTVDIRPPVLPAVSELPSIPKLPDPFKFMDGKRMARLDDWECRHSEISILVQEYVYGPKPPRPSSVTGSFSDNQLTVNCSENEKSISFTANITYPPTGTAPYPAIITMGPWLTLPKTELDNLGIAIIYFPNDDLASQAGASARGTGKFYDLYGSSHQASSLMAWAWGLSRLIDVLEQIPEANINPAKLGVTGCSRNGKGALVCGAFDERIALTIPTESGAGGASSWRVADALVAAGGNVQTARQIVTENTWMAPVFAQFGNQVDRLPVDQHMVAALCAPRPLLITENTAFEWLGPEACYTTAVAAHKVWEALGVPDRMGFVQTSHGDHCGFKEIEELRAFCTRFLLDGIADTNNVLKTDGRFDLDPNDWIDWDVPELK
ncbi:MAG: DNRLRE domain-containing protein [Phycisphaerales bacterium]